MTLQSKSCTIKDIILYHGLLNTKKILPAYSPKIGALFMQKNQLFLAILFVPFSFVQAVLD